MHFKKLLLATAIVGAFGLTACGDETANILVEGDTTTNNTNTGGDTGDGALSSCPDFAQALAQDADGNDVCALPASIMEDTTLTADTVWLMTSRVTVGNGNQEMSDVEGVLAADDAPVAAVTLTIEAGTQIKGKTGTFANLLITRGSRIMAEGTADAPIVFSSDDDDFEGSGEWGGLILQGYAPHNECLDETVACNVDAEGESGLAGGYSPDDSSGVLSYVVLTEGGYEFAVGNEINGISFVAVGAGTSVDHIQVNANADDGVEFFGGTVSGKYIVLTGNDDDSVDWDEGFQGNLQYVLVKQLDGIGDFSVEADTFGNEEGFLSKPFIANATFVAAGTDSAVMSLKEGTGGFFFNSVMTATTANLETCVKLADDALPRVADMTLVFHNVIADCPEFGNADLAADGTVFMVAADLGNNFASQAAEAALGEPTDWDSVNATYPESTANPDFLDQTDFMGAVNPDGSDNWFEGWTLEGTL